MKALTKKAVIATLNLSPVFEAVALLAEELAANDNAPDQNEAALIGRKHNVTAARAKAR
jgi:hypothetical protein